MWWQVYGCWTFLFIQKIGYYSESFDLHDKAGHGRIPASAVPAVLRSVGLQVGPCSGCCMYVYVPPCYNPCLAQISLSDVTSTIIRQKPDFLCSFDDVVS